MARRLAGLGRIPFVDPGNMDYLLKERSPGMVARAITKPRRRKWALHKWVNQGQTPKCSAFSLTHELSAAPIYHKRPLQDPNLTYAGIQAVDRAAGRNFAEGATTNAMAEYAVQQGWWGGYDWDYEGIASLAYLQSDAPIMAGTNWYSSMYDRDAEGIITITPGATVDGGHLFCINGYDPTKGDGLLRIAQTWGDGYYYITIPTFLRLVKEDGEIVIPRELAF